MEDVSLLLINVDLFINVIMTKLDVEMDHVDHLKVYVQKLKEIILTILVQNKDLIDVK